ncbi:uncharacterized protein [Epargyreus clarus]|uniref:uncharacterized protein isoform X2 n=1 Tax=Epargyreus clarus TaxID=520877 RepID=UPI003C2EA600
MNCIVPLFLSLCFEFAISSCSNEYEIKLNKKQSNFTVIKNTTLNFKSEFVNTTLPRKTSPTTLSRFKLNKKKWQIDRVTKKHFEIINVLWQKTKIFLDIDYSDLTCKATTTESTPEIQARITSTPHTSEQLKVQTSTPSYIEFYYLDQSDDRIKRKHSPDSFLHKLKEGNKSNTDRSNVRKASIPLLFKFLMNAVPRKHTSMGAQRKRTIHKISEGNIDRSKINKSKTKKYSNDFPSTVNRKSKVRSSKREENNILDTQAMNVVYTSTISHMLTKGITSKTNTNRLSLNLHPNKFINHTAYANKSSLMTASVSTAYDKVKFFEMYDSNTPQWEDYIQNVSHVINNANQSSIKNDEKILLQHVNIVDTGHNKEKNKTRHVKKDTQNLNGKKEKGENEYLKNSSKPFKSSPFQKHSDGSRLAVWSDFPFVGVYIYEPSQVHCDAASISPHWLLAAASCLSRHHNELRGGLSAFVTYCSEDWRHPHRVSYVKRTLIHPSYQPRDGTRHLFNAGVIQVVNSMADTCNGWAPVSLMSHQFTADQEGSIAAAVGWGLDRYDQTYSIMDIPKHPLMIYEGLVHSQSCPGKFEYRTKTSDEDEIRNVYCLSLPPYLAEENDTVHGALLLIGGKLLALYLQEERRPWGVQSAQYSGLWRLLPWLADTAREPDDLYAFQFEI